MQTKFFLLVISFLIQIFSSYHAFGATCKDGTCDNSVYGSYVTTDAQRTAATKWWITIDPATGTYNKQSVEEFQRKNGITVDGKIWPETAGKLTSLAASASTSGWAASAAGGSTSSSAWGDSSSTDWPITVIVTEKIPGADCTCIVVGTDTTNAQDVRRGGAAPPKSWTCGDPKTRKYSCTAGKWLSGFQSIFREITRWVVYITMLLGVMAIAGAGILWAWGSESEEYTKKAKGWVINILIGLVILFTFRYILSFIAPWIFQ